MNARQLTAAALVMVATGSFAGDKGVVPLPPDRAGAMKPGRGFQGPGDDGPEAESHEARQRQGRLMAVVAIADALDLTEAEALKVGDKLKGFDDRRKGMHESMFESMRSLRAASEGDAAALPLVDANVQKILDGRTQMAALDKELFNSLAQGLSPQKRARLALVLGQLHQFRGGGHKGGRGPGGF